MLKAIWKGIAWFFKQPDDSKIPVRGKPMFSRPGSVVNVGTTVKVNRNVEGDLVAGEAERKIIESYNAMVTLTGEDQNAIELAQSKRFGPLALTDTDIEYVLNNSDIVHQRENTIKAINLALNFQYVRFASKIEELTATLENVIAESKEEANK